jgi:hypothetical protein
MLTDRNGTQWVMTSGSLVLQWVTKGVFVNCMIIDACFTEYDNSDNCMFLGHITTLDNVTWNERCIMTADIQDSKLVLDLSKYKSGVQSQSPITHYHTLIISLDQRNDFYNDKLAEPFNVGKDGLE